MRFLLAGIIGRFCVNFRGSCSRGPVIVVVLGAVTVEVLGLATVEALGWSL